MWILIIIAGLSGPSISIQEFESQRACDNARIVLTNSNTKPMDPVVKAYCFPKKD